MGKLTIIGIGPGDRAHMTSEAVEALLEADLVCGYTRYVELVADLIGDTETLATGMTGEIERCRAALDAAASGRSVAIVCSGDAGVYGMAGLVYELAGGNPDVDVRVVPGVTAALSGAALLGAPIAHDFCTISLSDLLTPWEVIERRLAAAASAGFCIVLYNPASKHRPDHLRRACDVLLEHKPPETVCGIARNIGRDGEDSLVCTLAELRDLQVDMGATVFIGNVGTRVIDGKMVTPRGYEAKPEWEDIRGADR